MAFMSIFYDCLKADTLDGCDDEQIAKAIQEALTVLNLNTKHLFLQYIALRLTKKELEHFDPVIKNFFTKDMTMKLSKKEKGRRSRRAAVADDDKDHDDDNNAEERGAVASRQDGKPRHRTLTRDTRVPGKILALNLNEDVDKARLKRFAERRKLQLCLLFERTLCLQNKSGFDFGPPELMSELQLKYEPRIIVEADKHFIERQLLRHYVSGTKKRPEPWIDLSGFAVAIGDKLKGDAGEKFLRRIALKKAQYGVEK